MAKIENLVEEYLKVSFEIDVLETKKEDLGIRIKRYAEENESSKIESPSVGNYITVTKTTNITLSPEKVYKKLGIEKFLTAVKVTNSVANKLLSEKEIKKCTQKEKEVQKINRFYS